MSEAHGFFYSYLEGVCMKPNNFSFVIPNRLAGMGFPGISHPLEEELKFLQSQGIGAIVSLTEQHLPQHILPQYQIESMHLPIRDFCPPTLEQVKNFTTFVENMLEQKKGVAVHCQAGIGRTGTMLACYLVKLGNAPTEAIQQIRNLRPGSIETLQQEQVVFAYAAIIGK